MLRLNKCRCVLFNLSVLLVSSLLASACTSQLMQKQFEKKNETAKVVGTYHEFVAVGYAAVAAQKGDSDDIRMLNAIKASKLDAYKELAEQVFGVMLTSENSVKEHQLQDEVLDVKVTGLVRGAKVLKTYHEENTKIRLAIKVTK